MPRLQRPAEGRFHHWTHPHRSDVDRRLSPLWNEQDDSRWPYRYCLFERWKVGGIAAANELLQ